MAQKFKFPMEYLRVTQKENTGSHVDSFAIDFGGKDTGADRLYAPCDMVVKRCRHNANGELYLESIEPVLFADGTTDYARLICIHDGVFNVKEGQVLKQGDYFYDEGGMGSNNPNRFATHVHMEGGKGKWNSTTQFANSQGTYVIENQSHLYDMFILGNDVVIMTDPKTGEVLDGGYPWKRETEFTENNIAVNCKDCEHLKAEMAQMEVNHKAETDGYIKTIDGYIRDIYKHEELLMQTREQLTVAQETAEIARGQMEHDDFYIQQLKEKIGTLTVENGTLKETITSLQEKIYEKDTEIEDKTGIIAGLNVQLKFFVKEVEKLQKQIDDGQQRKENLLVRIFDKFMEWIKGGYK